MTFQTGMEFHILPCDMYTHTRTHAHTHTHTHILNRCHVSHQSCLDYWSKSEHTDSCAQPYHSLIPRPCPAFCRLQYRKRYFQSYAERAWEREAISFIHLILQFVFYSLKKPMISDRKKKLETAPIKSDSVYNTQKREKNGDVFPYK